jgi:hypothetical protein
MSEGRESGEEVEKCLQWVVKLTDCQAAKVESQLH